ncbi:hypothetical protein F2Q69_00011773 [Brassica cretica]|uniref:HTH myb-type domain-containing protein n=1 Tax=Brassica cretica TaxID=69181 RepID=A0A8S9QXV1_BRACR|nr:hypothetical protein F2Q69_00011773 [Brassica cretica]
MLLMNEAIERLKQEASSVQGVELETDNKKNWMSSSQLWISNSNSQSQSKRKRKQRGAIMSFNRPPPPPPSAPLTLPTSEILTDYSSRIEQSHPIQKKELRRKWSEELHWRITDALQKIGGSQVATPKQIRDIMKVHGLTNDEVKSQLQTPKTEQWVLPQLPDPSYPPTNLHLPSLSRPKPSPENLAVQAAHQKP